MWNTYIELDINLTSLTSVCPRHSSVRNVVSSVLLWQTLRQDTPWLEVGTVWTEIGLNTLYYSKLWKRNNVVPGSNMGLMSSIRKSFFSCQMVDITLSDSCFFAIATPCLCLFTEGRGHCTCVLPHSLALIFSPASLTVCNFFFLSTAPWSCLEPTLNKR